RRILRRRARDEGPRSLLRIAAWQLSERRDFPEPWQAFVSDRALALESDRALGLSFDREAGINALLAEMRDLGAWSRRGNPDDYFNKSLGELHHFVREITRTEREGARDYDGIEARLGEFCRRWHSDWVGYRSRVEGFPKDELIDRRNSLKVALQDFVNRSGADLAPKLRDELWEVIVDYERLKERAGCVDFLDLLLRARNLVRDNGEVRRE